MGHTLKPKENSHIPSFAKGTAKLINAWRAEARGRKTARRDLQPNQLEGLLHKADECGVPLDLAAHTVLACEWAFRVRQATEEDVQHMLSDMQDRLCTGEPRILTPIQAHCLIAAIESTVRRQILGIRVPVVLGLEAFDYKWPWPWVLPRPPSKRKRTIPKPVVKVKPGLIPMLGPIISGVILAKFLKHHPTDSQELGMQTSALLLQRKVLPHEFLEWQGKISTIAVEGAPMDQVLSDRIKTAHEQAFEHHKIPRDLFLERCRAEPESVLHWVARKEFLQPIYRVKWG
jgi:hypothetical protein